MEFSAKTPCTGARLQLLHNRKIRPMHESESRPPVLKHRSQNYTLIGRIAYHLLVPLITFAAGIIGITSALIALSLIGVVPENWPTQEVSLRTVSIILVVAAVIFFYFPAGRLADSAMQALASWGLPVL